MKCNDADAKLNDPAFFATDAFYDLFDEMRRADPVHWTSSPDGRGYWSVFRHADVKSILNDAKTFSSEREGIMPVSDDAMAAIAREAMGVGLNVLTTDPPRHDAFRAIIAPPFMPRALEEIEPRVKAIIAGIFDDIAGRDELDLVTGLATRIPMAVICDLLDLPADDWDTILGWGKMAIAGTDPEYMLETPAATVLAGCRHLHRYGLDHARARRGCPDVDALTRLAQARIDGVPLTDDEIGHSSVQLMIAGFETTRNVFSGGVLALLRHPEQMALLRENPKRLRLGVEEFVRWADPVISLMRVATADTTVGGRAIHAGDRVVVWLPSANRDEDVFDRPYAFDVTRHPNHHLGFGAGPHFCVGGPLSKMEVRLAMEQLLVRYDGIEVTGPTERVQSSFLGGLKHLPVRLVPRRSV